MRYEEVREMECPICGRKLYYDESFQGVYYLRGELVAERTYDCHGIPFRTVCEKCYDKVMDTKGYDGEYYTELDECIDYDY